MTLGDGVERGIRMLEFRTGTGLRFTVLVDRAMDIAECEYNGRGDRLALARPASAIPACTNMRARAAWPGRAAFPACSSPAGWTTSSAAKRCRPTATTIPAARPSAIRCTAASATIPARLTGYGEAWEGDAASLWAEGVVRQATVFGEDLHLIRRIEAEVGGNEIRLHRPRGEHGFCRRRTCCSTTSTSAIPLLDEGTRYLAPITDVVWAAHAGAEYRAQGVGYRPLPAAAAALSRAGLAA